MREPNWFFEHPDRLRRDLNALLVAAKEYEAAAVALDNAEALSP